MAISILFDIQMGECLCWQGLGQVRGQLGQLQVSLERLHIWCSAGGGMERRNYGLCCGQERAFYTTGLGLTIIASHCSCEPPSRKFNMDVLPWSQPVNRTWVALYIPMAAPSQSVDSVYKRVFGPVCVFARERLVGRVIGLTGVITLQVSDGVIKNLGAHENLNRNDVQCFVAPTCVPMFWRQKTGNCSVCGQVLPYALLH